MPAYQISFKSVLSVCCAAKILQICMGCPNARPVLSKVNRRSTLADVG